MIDQAFSRQAEQIAVGVNSCLVQQNFDAVLANASPFFQRRLSGEQLALQWAQHSENLGRWCQQISVKSRCVRQFLFVTVVHQFERGQLSVQLALDSHLQPLALRFMDGHVSVATVQPDYIRPASFTAHPVESGTHAWPLSSVYLQPQGDGPFPAVLLMHDAGPLDMDACIGGRRPFKDLAEGLASQGIAVLRYHKRTFQYQCQLTEELPYLTVEETSIRDAIALCETLRTLPGVDAGNIYIAGLGLGGALLPRVAARDERIAGMVMLSAPAQALSTMVYRQLCARLNDHEQMSERQLALLQEQVELINNPYALRSRPADELLLGAGGRYWLDLENYRPAVQAELTGKACLVLQGGQDTQVSGDDFDLWQQTLLSCPGARFHLFPGLDHLFMDTQGDAKHVAPVVIEVISRWIHERCQR